MLKVVVTLWVGAAILLASAVWSGTVMQARLIQLEPIQGPDNGAARLVP